MNISLNPQSLASRQGREFADECIRLATRVGFVVRDQRVVFPECGVEVDLVIENQAGRLAHLVEDPPAGCCDGDVLRRIAAIRRLLDDAVMLIVFQDEGGDHAAE